MQKYRVEIDEYDNVRWFKFGTNKLHRENGLPAIEWSNGSKFYYVNGQRHRDGGLPAIEAADGYKAYWVNGKKVTEEEAKRFANNPCANKVVEIDGLKYSLTPVE